MNKIEDLLKEGRVAGAYSLLRGVVSKEERFRLGTMIISAARETGVDTWVIDRIDIGQLCD